MLLNNPGGLDGPFIFTSASSAVYAQIHAAGNTLGRERFFSPTRSTYALGVDIPPIAALSH
jgi:hypothetical protein